MTMHYDIKLAIEYSYEGAATFSRHLLRLMPLNLPGEQRMISGLLTATPEPDERVDRVDFFGNPCVEVGHNAPHETLSFQITARVERTKEWVGYPLTPYLPMLRGEIDAGRALDANAAHHFLSFSRRIKTDPLRASYAWGQIDPQGTVLDAVTAIGGALYRDMTFNPDATSVDTPPEEAFARRSGVCQDYSQIMIGALRDVGVPAGYVSGFLRTEPPPGQPRLEGADAMHAWVRAWCGQAVGWVEFDPTNNVFAGTDHVVVARGRDYSDVAPVKGILRAFGTPVTSQAVDMIPLG